MVAERMSRAVGIMEMDGDDMLDMWVDNVETMLVVQEECSRCTQAVIGKTKLDIAQRSLFKVECPCNDVPKLCECECTDNVYANKCRGS